MQYVAGHPLSTLFVLSSTLDKIAIEIAKIISEDYEGDKKAAGSPMRQRRTIPRAASWVYALCSENKELEVTLACL